MNTTDRSWEIDNIKSDFEEKVTELNKAYYKQFQFADGAYVELKVGEEVFSFREMFVPRNGETHISWHSSPDGFKWSYAHKLTAEEKKNAPVGADWCVDNVFATCVAQKYCYG